MVIRKDEGLHGILLQLDISVELDITISVRFLHLFVVIFIHGLKENNRIFNWPYLLMKQNLQVCNWY